MWVRVCEEGFSVIHRSIVIYDDILNFDSRICLCLALSSD